MYAGDKDKRNAIFIVFMVFGFPAIALVNYAFEIKTGILSQAFRGLNLIISFIFIYDFLANDGIKSIFRLKINKQLFKEKAPIVLFAFFWIFYLLRIITDIEIYNVHELTSISKNHYYLFTVGVTIIPMIGVFTVSRINFNFLKVCLHRYLVVLNCLFLLIFFIDKIYYNYEGYRFLISSNQFDYLDAITIAVYGGLLVLLSFLNVAKSKFNYVFIYIGSFVVLTTASRGPILSILLALLFILLFKDKKISLKYLYLMMTLFLAVLGNYLISMIFDKYFFLSRFIEHDQSNVNRIKIIINGFNQFLEGPFFGTHFLVIESKMYAHNILLDILLSTGLLGFILIIPMFLIFAKNIMAKLPYALISVIGFFYFLNTLTSGASYNMNEFWILFAIVVAYKTNDKRINKTIAPTDI